MKAFVLFGIAGLILGQELPDGPGKETTKRMCSGCHGFENITGAKKTQEQWSEMVDDMIAKGAKGTDAEIEQVIAYLAAHFGPRKK